MSTSEQLLAEARAAVGDQPAWLVGGAVRDRLLGRGTTDLDLALAGDTEAVAKRLARATGGAPFALSDAFGAWRVVARDHAWQIDLVPLREGDVGADLAARDFTVNAMAQPLAGGELIDPHGGRADLEAGRLRMVSESSLSEDPLRTLRAARLAAELGLVVQEATAEAVRRQAGGLADVAAERVFGELKRLICTPRPREAMELMEDLGVAQVVLPEVTALRGVEQNVFHHADVHDHSLEVLEAVAGLEEDPSCLGEQGPMVRELLAAPFADELTRGQSMRLAALLHDAAKPATRGERPDGRVTFIGHDAAGAELARAVLRRLRASERLCDYVAALTRHHLRVGFLVHERPLGRRTVWRYLRATEPYADDVTVFTVADRLATRGRNAEPAIAAHLEVARELLAQSAAWAPTEPLLRGDELAGALGRAPGPWLAEVLARLEEDRYAGEITTREQALDRARELLAERG